MKKIKLLFQFTIAAIVLATIGSWSAQWYLNHDILVEQVKGLAISEADNETYGNGLEATIIKRTIASDYPNFPEIRRYTVQLQGDKKSSRIIIIAKQNEEGTYSLHLEQ